MIEDFPFMLRHSKHCEPFFSNLLVRFNYSVARRTIETAGRNKSAAASRGQSPAAGEAGR